MSNPRIFAGLLGSRFSTTTAEIKTGQRRVLEYFLSPLLQYKDESLRER